MWNYVITMAGGCGLMILVFMFARYRQFYKRGIPGLNGCLYMMALAFLVIVISLALLLLPEEGPLEPLVALNYALSTLGNAMCYRILLYLVGMRTPRMQAGLRLFYIVPTVSIVAALADARTGFFVQEVTKLPDGFGYDIVFGTGMWILNGYTVVLTAGIIIVLLYQQRKSTQRRRIMWWILVATALVPQSLYVLAECIPYLTHVHISSLMYWLPVVLLTYLFYGYLQTARRLALEEASGIYVVFDRWGDCVDINRQGETFFQTYVRTAHPKFQDFLRILQVEEDDAFAPREFELTSEQGQRSYYRAANFRISNTISRHCGDGFLIEEITEYREQMHKLDSLASEDPLTGLKNRRYLDACAGGAMTPGKPVTLLMMDIDHFKRVNDTYGHTVGDEVLQMLGKRCNHVLRRGDILCRYGGEEFVVFLPHDGEQTGRELAQRILQVIRERPFATSAGEIPITISIGGYSAIAQEGEDIDRWIARADEMLYRAKQSGRNRVEYAVENEELRSEN